MVLLEAVSRRVARLPAIHPVAAVTRQVAAGRLAIRPAVVRLPVTRPAAAAAIRLKAVRLVAAATHRKVVRPAVVTRLKAVRLAIHRKVVRATRRVRIQRPSPPKNRTR